MASTRANWLCTIDKKIKTVNLLYDCTRPTGYKPTTLGASKGPLCSGFVGHCTCGHLLNPPLPGAKYGIRCMWTKLDPQKMKRFADIVWHCRNDHKTVNISRNSTLYCSAVRSTVVKRHLREFSPRFCQVWRHHFILLFFFDTLGINDPEGFWKKLSEILLKSPILLLLLLLLHTEQGLTNPRLQKL